MAEILLPEKKKFVCDQRGQRHQVSTIDFSRTSSQFCQVVKTAGKLQAFLCS